MTGLLIKDFMLMKNQKTYFVLIFAIAVCLGIGGEDPSFIVSYAVLLGSMFTVSSISIDEYDNGYACLLSLPVTRKGYVAEKYAFGAILGCITWLAAAVVSLAVGFAKGWGSPADVLTEDLLLFPTFLIMLAVTVPFMIKFGSEKGRIFMAVALGGLFVVIAGGVAMIKSWNPGLLAFLDSLSASDTLTAAVLWILASVLLYLLSARISVSIMNRKEI